jgi:hypothetical protein
MSLLFSPDSGNHERLSLADETIFLMHEYVSEVVSAVPVLSRSLYGRPPLMDISPSYVTVDPILSPLITNSEVPANPVYADTLRPTGAEALTVARQYSQEEEDKLRQIRLTIDLEAKQNDISS